MKNIYLSLKFTIIGSRMVSRVRLGLNPYLTEYYSHHKTFHIYKMG